MLAPRLGLMIGLKQFFLGGGGFVLLGESRCFVFGNTQELSF